MNESKENEMIWYFYISLPALLLMYFNRAVYVPSFFEATDNYENI